MTCGITDGKEHRLVLHAGFLEGFIAPWVPVHGIVGVLKKIARLFVCKAVGMGGVCYHNIITPKIVYHV